MNRLLLAVLTALAYTSCVPVPTPTPTPTPTPPKPTPPTAAYRAVSTVVVDSRTGAPVVGAQCDLQDTTGWLGAPPSNTLGYVLWLKVSTGLTDTGMRCTASNYVAYNEPRVLPQNTDVSMDATPMVLAHVDPAAYSAAALLTFRGALFTVKANHLPPATGFCDLPYGPRPHQPDNIAYFGAPFYTTEQRQCVYQLWKERGYTHGPVGPFIDPGYHGETPPVDFRTDGGAAAADLIQEVWDAGLIPVVFVTPDGWQPDQLRTLNPIFQSPRWQALVRVVVNGFEQQGSKYGWSNQQYIDHLSWLRDAFPTAVRGLHTIADIEAPVGNGDDTSKPGMSNGECWGRVTPLIHFWLHQSEALFHPDHVADNGKTDGTNWLLLWDRSNPYSLVERFGAGNAGWPTTSANGGPLLALPGEYASYPTYWSNQPEDVARDWGAKALAVGAPGFMDGGRE